MTRHHATGYAPTRIQRTPISGPALRIRDTLVPVTLAVGAVFVLVGWTAAGFDWIRATRGACWLVVVLCGSWLLAQWFGVFARQATVEEYAPQPVAAETEPETDDTDAQMRRFAQDALIQINGEWAERQGGASWRAMQARGWDREAWVRTRDLLLESGLLRWAGPDPRQGTAWHWQSVRAWLAHE